jgi:hypothetical protein
VRKEEEEEGGEEDMEGRHIGKKKYYAQEQEGYAIWLIRQHGNNVYLSLKLLVHSTYVTRQRIQRM